MADLDSVAKTVSAFYRLVGTVSADAELTRRGESSDEVAYHYLTRGVRRAQRYMIGVGFHGWRTKSSALTFTGSDDTDGGRYFDLTSLDPLFLRVYGDEKPQRSALIEPNGKRWGGQVEAEQDHLRGNRYYIKGEQLWLTRNAQPPTGLLLDYHHRHAPWEADVTIDFPLEARPLIPAEAAYVAMNDNWLPGGPDMKVGIASARQFAREEARDIARPTKAPRKIKKATRFGNRW